MVSGDCQMTNKFKVSGNHGNHGNYGNHGNCLSLYCTFVSSEEVATVTP